MPRNKKPGPEDIEKCTLEQLCDRITAFEVPFEDCAPFIEREAFAGAERNGLEHTVKLLGRLAEFFENMENKNEENSRDLVDVYILVGELYQAANRFEESIGWFKKSIIINDRYPVSFHSLAVSYHKLGDYKDAVRCLEQEILLEPGNYYAYLLLADSYSAQDEPQKTEETLRRLLDRNPDNIQALHRLIRFYEQVQPDADVELLRRRIVSVTGNLNRTELMIWTSHMLHEQRYDDALRRLDVYVRETPEQAVLHLLKALVYERQENFDKKCAELAIFKKKSRGNTSHMHATIRDLGEIFGKECAANLSRRLGIGGKG